jgi:hypothetical protein
MTTFDDRKDAFERKFAHDEELRFKATARRNKLLGLWAEEAGDDDVVRKVKKDFDAGGVAASEGEIKTRMIDLLEKAIDEVKAGR